MPYVCQTCSENVSLMYIICGADNPTYFYILIPSGGIQKCYMKMSQNTFLPMTTPTCLSYK